MKSRSAAHKQKPSPKQTPSKRSAGMRFFWVIPFAIFVGTTALIGAAVAWIMFDGNQKAIGSNVFNMTVSPGLVLTGIIWALVVGLIGGLFPSIRAARLPVATAIRAT